MWTEREILLLRQYHAEGNSAGLISVYLAAQGIVKTRNSVIGKLHRLGLVCSSSQVLPKGRGRRAVARSPIPGSIIAPTRNLAQVRGRQVQEARKGDAVNAEVRALKILAQRMEAAEILDKPETAPVKLIDLLDLEPHHCRFPCGTPGEDGFGFCASIRCRGTRTANLISQGR